MNKTLPLLAALLALAAGSASAGALQDLGAEAGVDVAPLVRSLKDARSFAAAQAPLMIPRRGQDVFEGCSAMDVKTFVALNPKQAAVLVQTCLNHVYAADGRYAVRAGAEEAGLKITVSGVIMTGDAVLLDLDSSLRARGGKLLGFPAVVDNRARIQN